MDFSKSWWNDEEWAEEEPIKYGHELGFIMSYKPNRHHCSIRTVYSMIKEVL